MKRIIEICANSAQSCVEAEAGGATRVELCAGIPEGGTTPSYGEIKTAKALTSKIDINVIIRPRGGDFLYTEAEVQSMLLDIELCKELKVHGVVFGCLTKDGDIDVPLMRRLIETAKPLSVTCHRAFDVCRDPFAALEQLIELGCDRILTSGQQSDAVKGIPLIAELVKRAAGRIIIMPGCGVRENNIARIEAAQKSDPDGFVGTNTQLTEDNHRWGANGGFLRMQHDVYNAGMLIEAGVHYYEATGDDRLLKVATRMADYMVRTMGPAPKKNIVPAHSGP